MDESKQSEGYKELAAKFEEVTSLSAKFTQLFANTYVSRGDGGENKELVLDINPQSERLCGSLKMYMVQLVADFTKNEKLKKAAQEAEMKMKAGF
jgi:hypothetical protein